jgi:hypothetical protein
VTVVQARSLDYNLFMERNAPTVVFRYRLWIRLASLFLLLILLALAGWMGSMSAQMVLRFSEPLWIATSIEARLALSLFGLVVAGVYVVVYVWQRRVGNPAARGADVRGAFWKSS